MGKPGCTCGDVGPGLTALDVPHARQAMATLPFTTPFPTPEYPPREWFDRPTWVAAYRAEQDLGPDREPDGDGSMVMKITVTDEGRVGGWFYPDGQCLVHMHDACPRPSPTRYAAFHQQDIVTADGATLLVGVIGNVGGHAGEYDPVDVAQAHYADPDSQMIVCRAGDDEHGGWVAGAVVPGLTHGDVALIRRCALSGDWRPMPDSWWKANGITASVVREVEGYDCIGPTLVNRPGLPLVRYYARTSAAKARWAEPLEDQVKITLPNGLVIEGVDDRIVTAAAEVLQAAEAAPVEVEPAAPAMDVEAEVTQLRADVDELRNVVGQVVDQLTTEREMEMAAIEAGVIPLPDAPAEQPVS